MTELAVNSARRFVELGIDLAGSSDLGLFRERNEDAFLIDPERSLLIVADGMGGRPAGDVAAKLVVQTVAASLAADDGSPVKVQIERAFISAEAAISRHVKADRSCRGMAAALAVALVRDERAVIAHLGDVRAYLARDGALRRLTNDHTPPGRMLETGELNEEEARHHPERNIVLEAVTDSKRPLRPQLVEVPLQDGDHLLLCSDGLWGEVPHAELAAAVTVFDSAGDIVARLLDRALANGGPDNITAVVFRYRSSGGRSNERAPAQQRE